MSRATRSRTRDIRTHIRRVRGSKEGWLQREAERSTIVAVEIPMVDMGASLNVAVAGSLVLYRLAGLV